MRAAWVDTTYDVITGYYLPVTSIVIGVRRFMHHMAPFFMTSRVGIFYIPLLIIFPSLLSNTLIASRYVFSTNIVGATFSRVKFVSGNAERIATNSRFH